MRKMPLRLLIISNIIVSIFSTGVWPDQIKASARYTITAYLEYNNDFLLQQLDDESLISDAKTVHLWQKPSGPYEIDIVGKNLGVFMNVYKVKYQDEWYYAKFITNKFLQEQGLSIKEAERLFIKPQVIHLHDLKKEGLKNIPEVAFLLKLKWKGIKRKAILFKPFPSGMPLITLMKGSFFKSKRLSAEDAVRFTLKIIERLDELHTRGYLHLDIKPENIWVLEDGSVIIYDYDLVFKGREEFYARRLNNDLGTKPYKTKARLLRYTNYIPTRADDLFSVVMTLAHMLVGNSAFEDYCIRHVAGLEYGNQGFPIGSVDISYLLQYLKDPEALGYTIHPKLLHILEKGLKGGECSYASGKELTRDLLKVQSTTRFTQNQKIYRSA
jgi:serine/threonine protein kinase